MARYKTFDGKPVSVAWHRVLTRARKKGVDFSVTSGHRTLKEQAYLYSGWIRRLPGFNLAAFPSPNAPHIRVGRADHAIDFGPDPESVNKLVWWLNQNGRELGARFTVSGEWWHVEVRQDRLRRLAHRIQQIARRRRRRR